MSRAHALGLETVLLGILSLGALGCAPTFVLKVPNVGVDWGRVVAMPADAEISELDFDAHLTLRKDWSAVGTANANEVLGSFLEAYGVRMFDGKSVTGTNVSFWGFREWAMTSLIEITEEIYGQPREKHHSIAEWRWRASLASWREALKADFVLAVLFQDSHMTTGRAALNVLSPVMYYPRQVGTACLIDMADGRIVWCEHVSDTTGSVRTQSGAQIAVDPLLTRFVPAGRPKGSQAFKPTAGGPHPPSDDPG
jgi:hypothetical protein